MAVIEGPKGQRVITAEQIAAMDATANARLVIELQDAINADPGREVTIVDTPAGGLLVTWEPKR